MVSLWPWKGKDSSPAAFEKTLSNLSGKIGRATSNLEKTRQSGRRYKALWTLYTSFAYLLYVIISALVIGWRNWNATEYGFALGAPVLIYAIRTALDRIYQYRTDKQRANLQSLQKQRDEAIYKLKEATKYNTTQQLLEKYGGTPHKPVVNQKQEEQKHKQNAINVKKRRETTAFLPPPPTANILGRRVVTASAPNAVQPISQEQMQMEGHVQLLQDQTSESPSRWQGRPADDSSSAGAEFAPNAFGESGVYATNSDGPKWYDRILDVVLGEDEASPKNRLALICRECRLVNGLAPPGTKALEAVGKWRCSACGTVNGEDQEAKKIIQGLTDQANKSLDLPIQNATNIQNTDDWEAESNGYKTFSEDGTSDTIRHEAQIETS